MSAREVIARALCVNPDRLVFDWPTADGGRHRVREWQQPANLDKADAILAALDAAGKAVVDRKALIEARDEITAYVKREYAGCEGYPSMVRRMERDLELARELGRLAAAKEGKR
jgi:hypothetical protein